jgi:endonuclease/exonuclease/phosphatase (EEP) superfamily protein YafD
LRTYGSIVAWGCFAAASLTWAGHLFRDVHWSLDVLGVFVFQGALLAGAAATGFAALRDLSRMIAALTLGGVLLLAGGFADVPGQPPPCPGPPSLKVAFANLHVRNAEPDAVLAWLGQADADVVILVELNQVILEAVRPLAEASGTWAHCLRRGHCETLAYSRVPGVQVTIGPGGGAMAVVEAGQGSPVRWRVIGVHLANPIHGQPGRQYEQAGALAELAAGHDGPVVIAGDFNAVPWGRTFDILRRESGGRLDRPAVFGKPTWPAILPRFLRIPIDNAVVSDRIACAHRVNGPDIGSDHLPQLISVGFPAKS